MKKKKENLNSCTCNQREGHLGRLRFEQDGYEHIVSFSSGFVCERWKANHNDPKSHGRGCVGILFLVRNKVGAVQFCLLSGWYADWEEEMYGRGRGPTPSDLGYHSPIQMFKWQAQMSKECRWLDGGPCYYDASTLNAKRPFNILINQGESALWAFLREYHRQIFEEIKK